MKKLLVSLGLLVALILTGCSQDETNTDGNNEETDDTEQTTDSQDVKVALLDVQLNLTKAVSTYQQEINAYLTVSQDETSTEEAIQTAKDEAKTAAKEATNVLNSYDIQVELPEQEKEQYENAITTLNTYYQQVESSMNNEELDLSEADATWDKFQEQITEIYEQADLMVPDMAEALS
ncbi:Septation ring formation regulator EzrA [Paraliobacillus sp. PM-2]|uniref:hypothetical protein n=1 Tax=Paraliobacillus sp. PM-2 TaxID=1462524 RepID=UPI00061C2529|nr:hypothetical protein [Paraliobacillus sp. PM-2]CQR46650.1 Septation ring formation regulator EzrA [Paraliobacillus sp. PM-2]